MRVVHKLQRKDAFRLADWLRARKEGLRSDPKTIAEVCSLAGNDLGVTIVPSHIKNVLEDVGLEIRFKSQRMPSDGPGVKARLARLEDLVAHLYSKLGESYPS